MAQLLVRKIDSALVTLLKKRAAVSGRSAEEEHRLILREALTGLPPTGGAATLERYLILNPLEDADLPLPERHHSSERPIDFS